MPLSGLKIFVAEDEAMVLMNLECTIEDAGGRVVASARTCSQAVQIAANDEIDVAILDVNLADCEVFDAAELLKQRKIPFAFYSGRANRSVLGERFPDAAYLPKPSSDKDVVTTLSNLARL